VGGGGGGGGVGWGGGGVGRGVWVYSLEWCSDGGLWVMGCGGWVVVGVCWSMSGGEGGGVGGVRWREGGFCDVVCGGVGVWVW